MTWLTWRQLRLQAAAVYALVAAACAWLALTGPDLARKARASDDVLGALTSTDRMLFNGGLAVLAVVPALIGVFWGAPLVARELETGTYRLAWNQSVSRGRWLATKLGLSVVLTALAVGVLSAVVTWWAHPLDGVQGGQRGSLPARLTPISFAMRGVVPVGYAVFALLLGTLIGLLLRRSVPAMALTLAVYVVLQVAVPLWVRPHLVPTTTTTSVISSDNLDSIGSSGSGPFRITTGTGDPRDWVLSNRTVDASGTVAELPTWFAGCLPPAPDDAAGGNVEVRPAPGTMDKCLTRLADEGYRQRLVLHPRSDFWPLQWTETGLYLGLAAVLAGLCAWRVRRLS